MHEATAVDHILDAAAAEFAEHGYGGARVDGIARRAAVNKAMLYYHVGDKAALYTAVLTRNFAVARGNFEAALAGSSGPREQLVALIDALVRTARMLPHHPQIMLREVASGGSGLAPEVIAAMAELLGVVRGVLDEGVREGVFRPVDPLLTHLLVLGTVIFMTATEPLRDRMNEAGVPVRTTAAPEQFKAFLGDLVLHGIANPTPDGGSQ